MAPNVRTRYASRLASGDNKKSNIYKVDTLNAMVMMLPFAEAHMALHDIPPTKLPVMGDDITLHNHVQACFFDLLDDGSPLEMTKPFLIRKSHLEALEHWQEWKTLQGYLAMHGLEPSIAFRNTPINLQQQIQEPFYVGDLRVVFDEGPDISIA